MEGRRVEWNIRRLETCRIEGIGGSLVDRRKSSEALQRVRGNPVSLKPND
jgi:hypothetical protein